MTAWAALACLLSTASGPETLSLPGFRLHLEVSDAIDPDRLEPLARPGVVLWVTTSSNLLKRSVAERLGRAEASYVQVRLPLGGGVLAQFGPRVHPWVSLEGLDIGAYRRWAPAGTALELLGALTEERARNVSAIRPQAVRWQPNGVPGPEEWERARGLAGLELHPAAALPACVRPLKDANRIRRRVPAAEAESTASGCGLALRLEVPAATTAAELRRLLAQYPGAELWARIGTEADAVAAAALVRLLTEALPAARPPPPPRAP